MILARIESVAAGGYGVARVDGFVHFVPDTVTGDLVEIEPFSLKKHYGFSRLTRLIEPSPWRTAPFCPYFGNCGGCQMQHIDYAEQIKIKETVFLEQMARIGGFTNIAIPDMVGSASKRIRMRFQIVRGEAGLFRRRSHQLCRIDRCDIASDAVNRALTRVRECLKEMPAKERLMGSATILAFGSRALIAFNLPKTEGKKLCNALQGSVQGCIVSDGGKRLLVGDRHIPMTVQGMTIYAGADAFVQVNPALNEQIVQMICEFMEGSQTVYDLFAGCGNFSLPLSRVSRNVVGVERTAVQVEAARYAAVAAGITNVSFVCGDSTQTALVQADGVVLDPPRSGLSNRLVEGIVHHRPEKVAYVSCNPATLARDLRRFVKGGYDIESVRLFDMFPHTQHIESVTLLKSVQNLSINPKTERRG
jgi:23S rRNA (uracil1939-C5)-methyltransferase